MFATRKDRSLLRAFLSLLATAVLVVGSAFYPRTVDQGAMLLLTLPLSPLIFAFFFFICFNTDLMNGRVQSPSTEVKLERGGRKIAIAIAAVLFGVPLLISLLRFGRQVLALALVALIPLAILYGVAQFFLRWPAPDPAAEFGRLRVSQPDEVDELLRDRVRREKKAILIPALLALSFLGFSLSKYGQIDPLETAIVFALAIPIAAAFAYVVGHASQLLSRALTDDNLPTNAAVRILVSPLSVGIAFAMLIVFTFGAAAAIIPVWIIAVYAALFWRRKLSDPLSVWLMRRIYANPVLQRA